jgi:hypothetical protein
VYAKALRTMGLIDGEILLLAFGVVAKLVIVAAVGATAAKRPRDRVILSKEAITRISRLSAAVMIPSLIVSTTGASISVQLLKETVLVVVFSLVTIGVGLLSMQLWGRLFVPAPQRRSSLWQVASLAAAFPNIVAIPLVAVVSICERRDVRADYDDDIATCARTGSAIVFVGSFAWTAIFFTYGAHRLRTIEAAESGAPAPKPAEAVGSCVREPINAALAVGTVIGLIAPLRRGLFSVGGRSPLRIIGGTVELLASPTVCVAVLLVGASLANVDLNALAAPDKSARDAEAPPPPPAKRSVGAAVYAVRGIISGFVIVRLLLVPAIVGALEALATATIPIPQARLGRAVLLISSGMPTAQIMIVLLHKFGLSQQASELSFLFVFQYAASIPTMTALISSVLNRVY